MTSLKDTISMYMPEFVTAVIKRLHDYDFKAYIVGGAIRDIFMGRPATDWDIVTSASADEIKEMFNDITSFSLKHETVTLVHSGRYYEITPIRDSYGAKGAIEKDLGHRDFTINAMAYDIDSGLVLDPHHGKKDIIEKTIRAVGDPEERFLEDPIRLLRAVRIAVDLGFRIEESTMETIRRMSDRLTSAARERIRDEFMKILMIKRPSNGFRILRQSGLLSQILPELLEGFMKRQNVHHNYTIYRHVMDTIDRVEPDPIMRLTALLHDIAKPRVRQRIKGEFRFFRHAEESALLAGEIMARLKLSNDVIREVTNLIEFHMINYDRNWSDGAVRRLIRRVGPDNMDNLMTFRKADLSAHGSGDGEITLLSELEKRVEVIRKGFMPNRITDLAIDGDKVMYILGIPPGPGVGRILKVLLEKVTDHPELNTEDRLTDLLKGMKGKKRQGNKRYNA
jgi:tRNA nucleotidyltransferase (CCA-adding enzyme)